MPSPVEEVLNVVTDKHRGWGRILLPIGITLLTLLGANIVWPRDRFDVLAAQDKRLDARVDSVVLVQAQTELRNARQFEEMSRQLRVLSILGCSKESRGTLAYRLADCQAVLLDAR